MPPHRPPYSRGRFKFIQTNRPSWLILVTYVPGLDQFSSSHQPQHVGGMKASASHCMLLVLRLESLAQCLLQVMATLRNEKHHKPGSEGCVNHLGHMGKVSCGWSLCDYLPPRMCANTRCTVVLGWKQRCIGTQPGFSREDQSKLGSNLSLVHKTRGDKAPQGSQDPLPPFSACINGY